LPAVSVSGLRAAATVRADGLAVGREADAGSQDRIERARRRELGATRALHEAIRSSEEHYARAARTLAAFDASVEATCAMLRRMGYLGDGSSSLAHPAGRPESALEAHDRDRPARRQSPALAAQAPGVAGSVTPSGGR